MGPVPPASEQPLLDVRDLRIGIRRGRRDALLVVDKADLQIARGEMLGLVGESGSGKTMVCRSLIGALPRRGAAVLSGSIRLGSLELASAGEEVWRRVRGRRIGYVTQSALAGLNPVMTIGAQLKEAIGQAASAPRDGAQARARELLDVVRIRRADTVLAQYPHQLSGGMRQRVVIASAIAPGPELLVADEPTTGLDVTVQAEIMKLLKSIQTQMGMAILLVSHDLALIDEVCDRVVVMHAGACVESGSVRQIARPRHPYTAALHRSRIELAAPGSELVTIAGSPPPVGAWQAGCRFAERCEHVQADCRRGVHPPLLPFTEGRLTACLHASSIRWAT